MSARRSSWLPFAGLLGATLVAKLVVLAQLDSHPLLQPDSGLDMAAHVALARRVLAGDVWLGPGLYYMSPVYTYFLAAALFVRDSLTFVRVVQAVLGTCAVACVFFTARAWFGRRAAWIAAVLAAATGEFTFYEVVILQSSLDTFLTSAGLLCLALALGSGSGRPEGLRYGSGYVAQAFRPAVVGSERVAQTFRPANITLAFVAGIVFGLATLNRPNIGIALAGVIVVLIIDRHWRIAAAIALGATLSVTPVVARNLIVSRTFALMTSQGGLNFYIGNHAGATGQYVAVPGIRSNIEGLSEDAQRVAGQALGHAASDAEASRYFTAQAFDWMRANPATAAGLMGRKVLLVLNWRHQWLDYSYPYYAHDVDSLLRVLIVGPWLLIPLGLTGLSIATRRSRQSGAETAAKADVWLAFSICYAVAVALFFVAERHRIPLLIAFTVTGGGAVDWILEQRSRGSLRAAAPIGAVLVISCAIAFWPFQLPDGRFEERLRLAKVLMNEGRFDEASRELDAAHRLDPSDAATEFNLGMALVSAQRAEEGIPYVRHAVTAGVAIPGARYALVRAIQASGDRQGAARLLRTFDPEPSDDPESCLQVAMMAMSLSAPDVAERYARRALDLRPGWADAVRILEDARASR